VTRVEPVVDELLGRSFIAKYTRLLDY